MEIDHILFMVRFHYRFTSATPLNNILHLSYNSYIFQFGRLLLPTLWGKFWRRIASTQEWSVNCNTLILSKWNGILQKVFSNAMSWWYIFIFKLNVHLCLFQMVQLKSGSHHRFPWWIGAQQALGNYLNRLRHSEMRYWFQSCNLRTQIAD